MGFCTGCGTALRDGDVYCGKCGRAVASAPLVQASTPTARPLPSLEGASSGSGDGDELAADRSLAERAAVPLEPGTPRALRFEGHMRAAGLLLVGYGGMAVTAGVAGLVLDQSPPRALTAAVIAVGAWVIVEGVGLRQLRNWARLMVLGHVAAVVVSLLAGNVTLSGASNLLGAAIGVGVPFSTLLLAYSVPPNTFTKAYREDPARVSGPRATPYRSPFFWIACVIAAGGYGMVAVAIAG